MSRSPRHDNTIIAKLTLAQDSLAVQTNSARRANDIRRRVESACGALLRNRRREQAGQTELFARMQEAEDSDDPAFAPSPPSEIAGALREHKQRYYEEWLDESIPALGGKTPRQAARLVSDCAELDLLLNEMENREARLPEFERADFHRIRSQLGL